MIILHTHTHNYLLLNHCHVIITLASANTSASPHGVQIPDVCVCVCTELCQLYITISDITIRSPQLISRRLFLFFLNNHLISFTLWSYCSLAYWCGSYRSTHAFSVMESCRVCHFSRGFALSRCLATPPRDTTWGPKIASIHKVKGFSKVKLSREYNVNEIKTKLGRALSNSCAPQNTTCTGGKQTREGAFQQLRVCY